MKTNRDKAIKAGSIVVIGYGFSQLLRLIGNMILTRLLVPEYFGIMSLAYVFIQGLNLFSDVGIEPSVIRSKNTEDPDFLNTAWSIQIIRGGILIVMSLVIAYPVSVIYSEPILMYIIPVIGIVSLIQGFNSTSLFMYSKELRQGLLTLIELMGQIVSIAAMITIAYFFRTIWSLVIGTIFSALLKMIWSHFLRQKERNRFRIGKIYVKEIISFGIWILFSTAMTFLSSQADRLLLGKFLTLSLFGIYNVAIIFAELPKQVLQTIGSKVLYPLINKYIHYPREELRDIIRKPRRPMLILLAFLVSLFCCFGDYIIISLYDDRYSQAAWMLPILAVGMWPLVLHVTNNNCLFAIGKPKYMAFANISKIVYMIVLLPFIYIRFGVLWAMIVIAFNDIPVYIIVNIGLYREKLSLIKQDLMATGFLVVFLSMFLFLRSLFELGLPGAAYYL